MKIIFAIYFLCLGLLAVNAQYEVRNFSGLTVGITHFLAEASRFEKDVTDFPNKALQIVSDAQKKIVSEKESIQDLRKENPTFFANIMKNMKNCMTGAKNSLSEDVVALRAAAMQLVNEGNLLLNLHETCDEKKIYEEISECKKYLREWRVKAQKYLDGERMETIKDSINKNYIDRENTISCIYNATFSAISSSGDIKVPVYNFMNSGEQWLHF